jgi:hypothetical protein
MWAGLDDPSCAEIPEQLKELREWMEWDEVREAA